MDVRPLQLKGLCSLRSLPDHLMVLQPKSIFVVFDSSRII